MVPDLVVRPLTPADGPALAAMLQGQSPDYLRHFTPFAFDEATVTALLARTVRDVYLGMYCDGALAGFFMLRGWDEGYDVPAYGVVVAQPYQGLGLGRLSLDASKVICSLRRARRLMLKVHPENLIAKRLYEDVGFAQTGTDPNGQLVYHLDLTVSTGGDPDDARRT